MKIALFANREKHLSLEVAQQIRDFFLDNNVSVVARAEEASFLSLPSLTSVSPSEIDFVISLGGDGTILRLVHHNPSLEAPILGINLGHLGFMTDVPLSDLTPSLEDLLKGEYTVEERLILEGVTAQGGRGFAINEIVAHRAQNPTLIDVSIHVDGHYVNTFSADGIIFATPNGSTAYSLAAGGPILTPNLEAVIITPISPHTISNRPIVLLPQDEIVVEYLSPFLPIEVAFDGFSRFPLCFKETLEFKKANKNCEWSISNGQTTTQLLEQSWGGLDKFVTVN